MTVNLRELAESELSVTLEGPFSLPIELIGPDGTTYTGLRGQVSLSRTEVEPETGMEIRVEKPVAALRKSSLTRVPADGEKWICKIPLEPSTTATLVSHSLEKAIKGGDSLGIILLYLTKLVQ
ncbi:MAG: hypothetical protein JRE40_14880, partial [Deltaproteobacteria bacterium]|nr:hypothetical protein [Deltaproteobacteria bacterium]